MADYSKDYRHSFSWEFGDPKYFSKSKLIKEFGFTEGTIKKISGLS